MPSESLKAGEPGARKSGEPPSVSMLLVVALVAGVCGFIGSLMSQNVSPRQAPAARVFDATQAPALPIEDFENLRKKVDSLEATCYNLLAHFKRLPQNEPSALLKSLAQTIDDHENKIRKNELRDDRVVDLERRLDALIKKVEKLRPAPGSTKKDE